LRAAQPGFEPAGRLTFRLALDASGGDLVDAYDIALSRARGLGGVGVVAAIDALPLDGASGDRSLVVETAAGRVPADHECRSVSPRYFDVMGIPVVEGRALSSRDRPCAPRVAVVNDTFARRYWPGECAVGRRVKLVTPRGDGWCTVVGVVGDVRQRRLDEAPRPEIYCPFPQLPTRSIAVVATAADGAEPAIRAGLAAIEGRELASDVRQLADVVDRTVAPRAELALVMGALAALALGLVAAGSRRGSLPRQ
jgi:putative ABC transport system permease protein